MIGWPQETKGAAIPAPRIYWPGLAVDAQGLRRSAAMPSPTMNKARRSCIHAESVGICCETTAGTPGPPWSTIVPLTVRSSSPSAPSVTVNVTMLPLTVAGSTYHWDVGMPGLGPYFQYRVPAGSADG